MPKAYVIVNVAIRDPERYKDYIQAATPTVAAHGGRYVVRGGQAEKLEGDISVNRIVVLEFPSLEHAERWHASPECKAACKIRDRAASTRMVAVEGTA